MAATRANYAQQGLPPNDWSEDLILEVALAKGLFTVSLKPHQRRILELCWSLKLSGRLKSGKARGGCLVFYPVRQ